MSFHPLTREERDTVNWRSWFIWGIAGFCTLYQFLLQTSISVIAPSFVHELRINLVQTGLLSSSYFYSYLTMQLPAGILVDRFGHRTLLTVSFIIITIGCIGFAFSHSLSTAIWTRIIMGLGSSAIIAASFSLVANWFPLRLYAMLIAVTDGLGMIGGVLGQGFLAGVVTQLGWRNTMVGCGVLALFIAIIAFAIVRSHPKKIIHANIQASELRLPFFIALKKVLKEKQVWICGLYAAMTWGVIVAFAGLWAIPYFQTAYQLSLSSAAWLSSLIFLSIAVFNPIMGWLPNYFSEKTILFFSALVFFISMTLLIYVPHLPLSIVIALLAVLGCCASGYILVFSIVRELSPPESRATALGLTNLFTISIGSPVLQPLVGFLLSFTLIHGDHLDYLQTHNYKIAFTVFPLCLFLASICCIFMTTRKNQDSC
jgi:MFS family permease